MSIYVVLTRWFVRVFLSISSEEKWRHGEHHVCIWKPWKGDMLTRRAIHPPRATHAYYQTGCSKTWCNLSHGMSVRCRLGHPQPGPKKTNPPVVWVNFAAPLFPLGSPCAVFLVLSKVFASPEPCAQHSQSSRRWAAARNHRTAHGLPEAVFFFKGIRVAHHCTSKWNTKLAHQMAMI